MIGTTVGSYRITNKVSVGGMGTVYKAEHTLIGKHAAVKVLHPELRSNRDVVQRFFNEAKSTSQIKHPGIVEMFDFGYLPSGDGYIIMEFLDGMSLARRLRRGGKMQEGEAALLLRSVCNALAAAHAKNIVHRDLKPDNIFLCPDQEAPTGHRPKILDFGIAKLEVGLAGPGNATKTGAVMGTPTYMSPEQCKGTGEVDQRADLYSIGCMFFEMVAGRPPFIEKGSGELIGAHLYLQPQSPRSVGAEISPEADKLIMRLLDKEPANRPQTAVELAKELTALAQAAGMAPPRQTPFPAPETEVDPGPSSAMTSALTSAQTTPSSQVGEPKPTTLSSAASQSSVVPKKSRVGIGVALVGLAVVIGAGVTFAVRAEQKARTVPAAGRTPVVAPVDAAAAMPSPAPVETAAPIDASVPVVIPDAPAQTHDAGPTTKPKSNTKPKGKGKGNGKGKGSGAGSGLLIETDV